MRSTETKNRLSLSPPPYPETPVSPPPRHPPSYPLPPPVLVVAATTLEAVVSEGAAAPLLLLGVVVDVFARVVAAALLGVAEDLVGHRDVAVLELRLLTLLLRQRAGQLVRVVRHGQRPVGLLDLLVGAGAGDGEHLVVVLRVRTLDQHLEAVRAAVDRLLVSVELRRLVEQLLSLAQLLQLAGDHQHLRVQHVELPRGGVRLAACLDSRCAGLLALGDVGRFLVGLAPHVQEAVQVVRVALVCQRLVDDPEHLAPLLRRDVRFEAHRDAVVRLDALVQRLARRVLRVQAETPFQLGDGSGRGAHSLKRQSLHVHRVQVLGLHCEDAAELVVDGVVVLNLHGTLDFLHAKSVTGILCLLHEQGHHLHAVLQVLRLRRLPLENVVQPRLLARQIADRAVVRLRLAELLHALVFALRRGVDRGQLRPVLLGLREGALPRENLRPQLVRHLGVGVHLHEAVQVQQRLLVLLQKLKHLRTLKQRLLVVRVARQQRRKQVHRLAVL
eukprot:Rhum_TRINITY_DN16579_c0_g1::Rhum_TRINITY_DN16579_c0_g1_i1::g.163714::m.163714